MSAYSHHQRYVLYRDCRTTTLKAQLKELQDHRRLFYVSANITRSLLLPNL